MIFICLVYSNVEILLSAHFLKCAILLLAAGISIFVLHVTKTSLFLMCARVCCRIEAYVSFLSNKPTISKVPSRGQVDYESIVRYKWKHRFVEASDRVYNRRCIPKTNHVVVDDPKAVGSNLKSQKFLFFFCSSKTFQIFAQFSGNV